MTPRSPLARIDLDPRTRLVRFRPGAAAAGPAALGHGPELLGSFHDAALAGLRPGDTVVLDLAALEYLTGRLLTLLLRARQAVGQRRARLVLAGLSPGSRDVLRVSRLEALFEQSGSAAEWDGEPDLALTTRAPVEA